MNRKQALIHFTIAMIAAMIFIIPVWLERRQSDENRLFIPNLSVNDIKTVKLQGADSQVVVEMAEKGWQVKNRNGYPANFMNIRQFIHNLSEVKIVRQPQVGLSQMGRLRLLTPEKSKTKSGIIVTLYGQNKQIINSFILGKRHLIKKEEGEYTKGGQVPTGCYVRCSSDSTDVFLLDNSFSAITANPTEWLDHSFVTMGVIKSITVKHKNPEDNWQLLSTDKKGNMKMQGLKENQKANLGKIKSLVQFFPTPQFNDLVTDKDILKHVSFDTELEIVDMNEFKYRFFLGNEIDDNTICKVKVSFGKPNRELLDKLKKENFYSSWHYQIPTSLVKAFKYKKEELIKQVPATENNTEVKK